MTLSPIRGRATEKSSVRCKWRSRRLRSGVATQPVARDSLPQHESVETNGMISPDNKWVAYASNETGDWEVYVTTYPNAAGKWQVSRGVALNLVGAAMGKNSSMSRLEALTAVPVNGKERSRAARRFLCSGTCPQSHLFHGPVQLRRC